MSSRQPLGDEQGADDHNRGAGEPVDSIDQKILAGLQNDAV